MKDAFGAELAVGDRVIAFHHEDYDDVRLIDGTLKSMEKHYAVVEGRMSGGILGSTKKTVYPWSYALFKVPSE